MLKSYKQHMPSRLEVSETRSVDLESVVTTTPIFSPKIFFKNVELVSAFRVRVIHDLYLGVSDDPLLAGDYPTVLVDQVLDPDDYLIVTLNTSIDNNLDRHTIEITNNGTVESIIQCWFEGEVDTALTLAQPDVVVI